MPRHLFFRRGQNGARTHHLHVVEASTFASRSQLLLRDYLRSHPADAERYAALKRELAAAQLTNEDHPRSKTDLIQELTDQARAERGLPSVPVWEE
jgi:GrpB-like predicted nucleotidyltransferase (UPF0157 family)